MSEDWLNLTLEENIALALTHRWSFSWNIYIKTLLTRDDGANKVKEEIERAIEDICDSPDERSRTFHAIAFKAGLLHIACPELEFKLSADLAYNMSYYVAKDQLGSQLIPLKLKQVQQALAVRTSIERKGVPLLTDQRTTIQGPPNLGR